MRKIPVFKMQPVRVAYALVDDDDFEELNGRKWYLHPLGYPAASIKGAQVRMHRLLVKDQPGKVTDHINCNKLDNRRKNLRSVSMSTNSFNFRGCQINSKSGIRGVVWNKTLKYWMAVATYEKVTLTKYCHTKKEAAQCVVQLRRDLLEGQQQAS